MTKPQSGQSFQPEFDFPTEERPISNAERLGLPAAYVALRHEMEAAKPEPDLVSRKIEHTRARVAAQIAEHNGPYAPGSK